MTDKPSSNEEEYFRKLEIEKMKKLEKERSVEMAEEEKTRLKELHFMKCPKCGMDLTEVKHEGITIDRCVSCNGTWFDAGEMKQLAGDKEGFAAKVVSIFK